MATIHCQCGEPLVDDLDTARVTIEDRQIVFRRGSDYVACGVCGTLRSVRSLRAEAVAAGTLAVDGDADDDELPPTISPPLQRAADEALAAIEAVADGEGDAWHGDYADVVLSALSDIHHEDEPPPADADRTGG